MAAEDKDAALPVEIVETVKEAERRANARRRCFICLTDEESSDAPGSWVDPCPCTLEAHQDCMLSWVLDCERTSKPLQCPVCKAAIEMEGSRDLLVMLNDLLQRRFTKTSPYILLTGFSMGVQLSLQMYGVWALWSFAGKKTMMRFLLGPDMVLDARGVGGARLLRERVWSSLVMMNVAPTLLFSQLLPNLSNKIFLPAASLYGTYHVMHDDTFFAWPPSPQLAMAVFPYIRSVYYNLWREFVLPYETKLNRKILGLPPVAPDNGARQDANQGRQARQQNAERGVFGLLQGLVDALDPNDGDEDVDVNGLNGIALLDGDVDDEGGAREGGEVMFELRIEEMHGDTDDSDEEEAGGNGIHVAVQAFEAGDLDGLEGDGDDEAGQEYVWQDEAETDDEMHVDREDGQAALPAPVDAVAADDGPDGPDEPRHEVPQAPPARRLGLGALLSSISNSVVSALVLPGVSYAMGEALRLVLPRAWTTTTPASRGSSWAPPSGSGPGGRPGLLQQQWGRSLVGGCLFVVLKDALRVYAKSRRVAAMGNRRVKNVDRRRREESR